MALKLYLGHKRLQTNVIKMIDINECIAFFQYGYSSHPVETNREIKPNIITQSDEIEAILRKRCISIINTNFNKMKITMNRTIIDFTVDYVKEKNLKYEILAPINQMRLKKKMYLPYELVGLDGV